MSVMDAFSFHRENQHIYPSVYHISFSYTSIHLFRTSRPTIEITHRDRPVRPSSMLGSCCQSFAPRLSLGPVRLVALFRPSRFLAHSPCLGQSFVLFMMTVCFSGNGIGLLTFAIHFVVMHVCSSGSGIGFPEELTHLWCLSGSGITLVVCIWEWNWLSQWCTCY